MPTPIQHVDVATLIGSWPHSLSPTAGSPTLLPNTLNSRATVLGIKRSTSYAIGSKSFILDLDPSGGGAPVAHTVSFPAGSYTLAQIVTLINTDVTNVTPPISETVAYDDNGFLRLRSPRTGTDSYVGLRSVVGAEDIFNLLGLFSGTVSKGGSIQQAQHVDPSRQVALPGQLGMQWGETFSVDVFNRAMMQLGASVDRSVGLQDFRKVPTLREEVFVVGAGSVQLNLANPLEGLYTGSVSTPTPTQLRDAIKVLDSSGNEYTRDVRDVLNGPTAGFTASIQTDTNKQLITAPGSVFVSNDVKDSVYVVATLINVGFGDALENIPLKVIEYISGTQVVVENAVATSGAITQLTGASGPFTGQRIRISTARAEVEAFYKESGFITRVEQLQSTLESKAVTRVEKNNRIACSTALFVTNGVKAGDLVIWTAASSADPYTNNGTYRVKTVVDEVTLELLASDYGPVILNPNVAGGFGTVDVKTDGDFWRTPYIKFSAPTTGNLAAGRGAVPVNGETIRLIYRVGTAPRSASVSQLAPTVRFAQGVPFETQKALMRIVGPSVSSFDEILFGENWQSIEKVDFRMDKEHYDFGRHSTIRPDVINMFPGTGLAVTVRGNIGSDLFTTTKIRLVDDLTTFPSFAMNIYGQIGVGDNVSTFPTFAALNTLGSNRRGDYFVQRGFDYAGAIIQGLGAAFALQAKSASFPSINTDADGVTSYRHYFTDGVMTNPHFFATSLKANTTPGNAFLALGDVINDGSAAQFLNNLIVAANGNVGVGFSTDAYSGGFKPLVPLHITARSAGIKELIRLEGSSDLNHDSVAIAWKPRRALPFFAFLEMDHDPNSPSTGDWIMNSVLTHDAKLASNGVGVTGIGESFWRWVQDASVTTALSGTWTWPGGGTPTSATVLATDTSQVKIGDSIRLDSDGQFFQIVSITANVSVVIQNPLALTIPTGATGSSFYSTVERMRLYSGGIKFISPDTGIEFTGNGSFIHMKKLDGTTFFRVRPNFGTLELAGQLVIGTGGDLLLIQGSAGTGQILSLGSNALASWVNLNPGAPLTIDGNIRSVNGSMRCKTGLTVDSGGATITAGNVTVSAGNVSAPAGNLTCGLDVVAIGNISSVFGDITCLTGTVFSDEFTYNLAKTRYKWAHGAACIADGYSNTVTNTGPRTFGPNVMRLDSAASLIDCFWDIHLPDGVLLDSIDVLYVAASSGIASMRVDKIDNSGTVTQLRGSSFSMPTGALGTLVNYNSTPFLSETIDNVNYRYKVRISYFGGGTVMDIHGIRFRYQETNVSD